ncbi:MAG TPA: YciI family protein [Thermoanaerobaculia bacterium]
MPQFVLMLRDSGSFPTDISAEEIQSIILGYRDWIEKIGGAGHKLRDGEGRIVVGKNGASVTDGPYAESKEILGGYVLIEADNYDEVVRRCQESPHLEYGSIEIRQVEV